MKPSVAINLLKKVQEDYNEIAESFSRSREKNWPEMKFLRDYISEGDKVLDIGCGSGRLFELFRNKKVQYFGIDFSKKLIEIAKRKYLPHPSEKNSDLVGRMFPTFVVVDALDLPFESCFFNNVFSIAVFHHIPSREKRIDFLREIKRVLKKGGKAHLTVWNLWQKKYIPSIVKSAALKALGKTEVDYCDIFVPFDNRDRYYHCFRIKEIKNLFKEAEFKLKEIRKLKRDGKVLNIYIQAEK
jgi:ubiquinone/menaquinone biosynthesis C-methylase UbiE